ncbi:unnamed protein product [[Actinomadura] parvosata subsp. kistnae]|uniref:hypothetical protein n=1 Tax=[Actinomadura] parvosata TaxID=1955412 RepID=UPI000D2D1B58|nr:hypothetical protein [Nonomuraea sp. ATCC 55076]SPL89779.1 unnamed protein product [Actinomadura parvosata subsp. kistnae]
MAQDPSEIAAARSGRTGAAAVPPVPATTRRPWTPVARLTARVGLIRSLRLD